MSSLGIHYLLVTRYPQTCMLGQHFYHLRQGVRILLPSFPYFESLEVVDENIWKPQLFDQLQVDRNHGVCRIIQFIEEPPWDVKPWLLPHHVEIRAELHPILLQQL